LQRAMREVQAKPLDANNPLRFSVLRVPFFLEPEYPRDEGWSETNRARLERKWGGKREFEAQKRRHRLKERGEDVGIKHFNLDRLASSTMQSHRLVQWVTKNYGCTASETLYNDLNKRHFEDGQKLNDRKMLIEAASKAGVDPAVAEAFLASGEGENEIEGALHILRRMGINSIPNFIIGARHVLSGAVHSTELIKLFREIERTGEGAPESAFAAVLGIPDEVIERPLEASA
jgi:predicted DsbA family dithiol-disulfide isomerase